MSDVYRSFAGFVVFDPQKKEISSLGKTVRNVTIEEFSKGFRVQVTLWPDHDKVKIAKGDVLFANGKYTTNAGQDKEGNAVTYHNLSATTVGVVSGAQAGKATAAKVESADDEGEGW